LSAPTTLIATTSLATINSTRVTTTTLVTTTATLATINSTRVTSITLVATTGVGTRQKWKADGKGGSGIMLAPALLGTMVVLWFHVLYIECLLALRLLCGPYFYLFRNWLRRIRVQVPSLYFVVGQHAILSC
jgi:hypothetical protein